MLQNGEQHGFGCLKLLLINNISETLPFNQKRVSVSLTLTRFWCAPRECNGNCVI